VHLQKRVASTISSPLRTSDNFATSLSTLQMVLKFVLMVELRSLPQQSSLPILIDLAEEAALLSCP
jgi:hypothetical protein